MVDLRTLASEVPIRRTLGGSGTGKGYVAAETGGAKKQNLARTRAGEGKVAARPGRAVPRAFHAASDVPLTGDLHLAPWR